MEQTQETVFQLDHPSWYDPKDDRDDPQAVLEDTEAGVRAHSAETADGAASMTLPIVLEIDEARREIEFSLTVPRGWNESDDDSGSQNMVRIKFLEKSLPNPCDRLETLPLKTSAHDYLSREEADVLATIIQESKSETAAA